ncbi:MAG: GAF domain-containing protein [Gemmatimonadales bacterium]|nr:MAG: GAF domain-containing protein [Gemmatimonadales bacterium]
MNRPNPLSEGKTQGPRDLDRSSAGGSRARPDVEGAAADSARLAELARTRLLDTEPEESFDRITCLVARVMDAPLALVNLIDRDRQFTKACVVPEGMSPLAETCFNDSFCQYPVALDRPLAIDDARDHPWVGQSAFVREGGILAYLGVPFHGPDGHALGSLCVASPEPREWTQDEVELMEELAHVVETEVALRVERLKATLESGQDAAPGGHPPAVE